MIQFREPTRVSLERMSTRGGEKGFPFSRLFGGSALGGEKGVIELKGNGMGGADIHVREKGQCAAGWVAFLGRNLGL